MDFCIENPHKMHKKFCTTTVSGQNKIACPFFSYRAGKDECRTEKQYGLCIKAPLGCVKILHDNCAGSK